MDANRIVRSKSLRLVVFLAYAALLLVYMPRNAVTVPVLMIALGLPLAFRLVPRNLFYGQRDWRTLRGPEETWYMQNTITGVAMLLIGIVWLVVLAIRS
jgi:hypothetical protein